MPSGIAKVAEDTIRGTNITSSGSNKTFPFPPVAGAYKYTDHLLELERHTPRMPHAAPPLPELMEVSTPLKADAWEAALCDHPDRRLVQYIARGLNAGFRIGFDRSYALLPSERNLPSAIELTEVVTQHLENETLKGRIVGPLSPSPLLHINRLGVVPKGHTPGK